MTNWESDDITLKNELKLIDDSYYRVYDDNDYEIWKERMLSIIVRVCPFMILLIITINIRRIKLKIRISQQHKKNQQH